MSKLYLVDYYSKGTYKNKIVKAGSELEAIKKSRVKNIVEIRNINLQNFNKDDFIKLTDRYIKELAKKSTINKINNMNHEQLMQCVRYGTKINLGD